MPEIRLFGIRHHGPGSARSLQAALDAFRPDCLLIEGPPDADALIGLAAHAAMAPPVALRVYRPDQPRTCAFFPFAGFSPEWVAMRHGIAAGAAVRFIDLPHAIQLADGFGAPIADAPEGEEALGNVEPVAEADEAPPEDGPAPVPAAIRRDPLGELAEAAGYPDGERWWDALIESRTGTDGHVFAAIADAMAALREQAEPDPDEAFREEAREAHMRAAIRKAAKAFEKIAVVCGAWHVPALARHDARGQSGTDTATLKGLPRTEVAAAGIEGFLEDSGTVLIHGEGLLGVVDDWLRGLDPETFTELLPLVRRTFASIAAQAGPAFFDAARAVQVLPILRLLLGPEPANTTGDAP